VKSGSLQNLLQEKGSQMSTKKRRGTRTLKKEIHHLSNGKRKLGTPKLHKKQEAKTPGTRGVEKLYLSIRHQQGKARKPPQIGKNQPTLDTGGD